MGNPENLIMGPPNENPAACSFFFSGFTNRDGAHEANRVLITTMAQIVVFIFQKICFSAW
jgi:hypothetical protein